MITVKTKNIDRLHDHHMDKRLFKLMLKIASRIVDAEDLTLNYLMPKAKTSRTSGLILML
jgi:hypothetical protein